MLALLCVPATAQADRFNRAGTWNGELGVGAFVLDNDSGFSVSGRARYYFTDNFAVGPALTAGFADHVNVYNARMLGRIGTVLGKSGKMPLELYAEAGVGAIIFDLDRTASPPNGDTMTDLVVPFGGGFVWHLGRGVGLHGGALLNVTTNDQERFYPEFFAGLFF